jgi:hypothetical protein
MKLNPLRISWMILGVAYILLLVFVLTDKG